MTIRSLIEQAWELAGSTAPQATMLSWINELEGQIAFDWIGADAWSPYTADDLDAEPLIGDPWGRGIYEPYLEAMLYWTHGEYDRYNNAKAMHEQNYLDFRKFVRRTHKPPCRLYCLMQQLNDCCRYYREEDPLNEH